MFSLYLYYIHSTLFPFLNHAVINDYTALHFETLLFSLLCHHCILPFTQYIYILNCVIIYTSLYCLKNLMVF